MTGLSLNWVTTGEGERTRRGGSTQGGGDEFCASLRTLPESFQQQFSAALSAYVAMPEGPNKASSLADLGEMLQNQFSISQQLGRSIAPRNSD